MKAMGMYLLGFLVVISGQLQAADWNSVQGMDVTLFYPGQTSWQWTLTQSSHSGAKKFRGGKNCRDCHEDEQADIGAVIVSGEKTESGEELEPTPIAGKPGSIQINVKTAHDADTFYVRLAWPIRPSSVTDKQDPDFASKITMMLADANVKEASRAGCWGMCHADLDDMLNDPKDGEGIKKYLSRSRTKVTRQGGGRNYKPQNELQELISSGHFFEYWQAKLAEGQDAVPVAGYVLEERKEFDPPSINVVAEVVDGKQVVTLSRSLKINDPLRKDIVAGTTYTVGFALHEAHASKRFHFVSFEYTLVLDEGDADLVAAGF